MFCRNLKQTCLDSSPVPTDDVRTTLRGGAAGFFLTTVFQQNSILKFFTN